MSHDKPPENDEGSEHGPESPDRKGSPDGGWGQRAMDRWEAAEDRRLAEDIVAHRAQQEILRSQGNHEGADAIEKFVQKLPVSDAIKADPQAYLDSLQPPTEREPAGAQARDAGTEARSISATEAKEISMNRQMAGDIIFNRQEQEILRKQGEIAAADRMEADIAALPLSDEIKAHPELYLDLPPDAALPPMADRIDSGATRLLFQYHPEGPNMEGFGPTLEDPDAIRSSRCWAPIETLFAGDGDPSDSSWAEMCDRLDLPEEVKDLYPGDQRVKTWDQISEDLALPEGWGFRTQLTIAEVPAGRMPPEHTVEPKDARASGWDGTVTPQHSGGGATEFVFDDFNEAWKIQTAEIPERADELLAKTASGDPLDGVMQTAHMMGNHTLDGDTDRLADDRYRPDGRVLKSDVEGARRKGWRIWRREGVPSAGPDDDPDW